MSLFGRLVVATLPLVPKVLVGRVAARYVAGETLEDAVATVRALNAEGALATVDVLGEEVFERERAVTAVEEYLRVLDVIRRERLGANVSIKLTLLGLKIDEDFCCENVERIARAAAEQGSFVRIDMEDHTTHDATLRIYHRLQPRYGGLGVVFQAYMRRLERDIAALPAEGANVRLCKGIYIEPRKVAWKGFDTVRQAFLTSLDRLLERGAYVAVATHDEYLVEGALSRLRRRAVAADRYEFQMLLGVDPELRRILLAEGHRLRVYVPFGRDWYPYSTRRLRENPEVARHVIAGVLRWPRRNGR